ncbi:hypothetical protein C1N53_21430 [Pontibacter sp. SGAir0037]|nr:hypothetical protein C1N53_21430 [Pontibacter sp. SGAir0037]
MGNVVLCAKGSVGATGLKLRQLLLYTIPAVYLEDWTNDKRSAQALRSVLEPMLGSLYLLLPYSGGYSEDLPVGLYPVTTRFSLF